MRAPPRHACPCVPCLLSTPMCPLHSRVFSLIPSRVSLSIILSAPSPLPSSASICHGATARTSPPLSVRASSLVETPTSLLPLGRRELRQKALRSTRRSPREEDSAPCEWWEPARSPPPPPRRRSRRRTPLPPSAASVTGLIRAALRCYAREGRMPLLGADAANFLLYTANGRSDGMVSVSSTDLMRF